MSEKRWVIVEDLPDGNSDVADPEGRFFCCLESADAEWEKAWDMAEATLAETNAPAPGNPEPPT